jgi:NAD-dependent SIR2 family protein deacetylase
VVEGSKTLHIQITGTEMSKIVFAGCTGCKMVCKARLVSGMLGIKGCKNMHIAMHVAVGHVFVEDSEDVTLALYGDSNAPFDVVHTTRSSNVAIQIRSGERYRIHSSKTRSVVTQIVRRAIVSEFADGGSADGDDDDDGEDHAGEMGVAVPSQKRKRGHANPEDVQEFFDKPEELDAKVRQLAALMRNAKGEWKYTVVYTGAGVSTSAQIPDYRGPAGAWTLADQGKSVEMKVTFEEARPTLAHMAIAELVRIGAVRFVTSTNVDALHMRSGVPDDKLAELHGNAFLEVCRKCKAHWLRPYDVTVVKGEQMVDDVHSTGRLCEHCGQPLFDSIVHFGEQLPAKELKQALAESKKSAVSLVLGTSMLVHPACDLPLNAATLIICNLQKTQYDSACALRIFGKTDEVMAKLMAALGISIPAYEPRSLAPPAPLH